MSIKTFEDEMFEEFKRRYAYDAERATDYYSFDTTQLLIELEDGTKVLYDHMDNTYRYIRRVNEYDENETRWRYEFSQRLRKKMQLKGMGHDILSDLTGISTTMISKYVTGKSTPSLYNAQKLAKALNCSITELVRFPK